MSASDPTAEFSPICVEKVTHHLLPAEPKARSVDGAIQAVMEEFASIAEVTVTFHELEPGHWPEERSYIRGEFHRVTVEEKRV